MPIQNQEATTVTKEFTTKIVLEYGIPDIILTDQGTNFVSELFKNVCILLQIKKIQTTTYQPENNLIKLWQNIYAIILTKNRPTGTNGFPTQGSRLTRHCTQPPDTFRSS